jgi:hypothetical protein
MTPTSQPPKPGCRLKFLLYPLFVILPLLCVIPGILIGRWHNSAQVQGKFAKWQQLPNPPQPAEAILAADTNSVYVQTASGIYYISNVAGCIDDLSPCWLQVERVDKSRFGFPQYGEDVHSTYQIASAPIEPFEELRVSERRAETYDETYYIRGRTGDIWVWHWGSLSFYTIGLVLLVYCGSMCWGIVIGIGLAWVIFVKVK